jgi:hypothetical protein
MGGGRGAASTLATRGGAVRGSVVAFPEGLERVRGAVSRPAQAGNTGNARRK